MVTDIDVTTWSGRTQENKNKDVISIKDFGAIGDGISDDSAAIQTAFNSGHSIFIPEGSFYVKSELIVTQNNIDIYGTGEKSKLIIEPTTTKNIIEFRNVSHVSISNIQFIASGNTISAYSTGCGVLVKNSSYCNIVNNIIKNHKGMGVSLYNSKYCLVKQNRFFDAVTSMVHPVGAIDIGCTYNSSFNLITENFCTSGATEGIKVQSVQGGEIVQGNTVSHNIVKNCGHYGINIYGNMSNGISECIRNRVLFNHIENITGHIPNPEHGLAGGAGIYILSSPFTICVGNMIIDTHSEIGTNVVEQFSPGAIGVGNSSSTIISNNYILNAGAWGMYITYPDKSVPPENGSIILSSNTVHGAARDAFYISKRATLTASNNTAINARHGFRVLNINQEPGGISFTGNVVRDITGTAYDIDNARNIEITGGTIWGCTRGIELRNSQFITISSMSIQNSSNNAITIANTCSNNRLKDMDLISSISTGVGAYIDATTIMESLRIAGFTSQYGGNYAPYRYLTENSETPSVSNGRLFRIANTVDIELRNFTNGVIGQEILIYVINKTAKLLLKLSTNNNFVGHNGIDRLLNNGDIIRATYLPDNKWALSIN